MFNLPWKTLTISVILILLCGLLLKRCDSKNYKEITDEKLKPTEKTAIIINDRGQVTEVTRGNENRNRLGVTLIRGWDSQSSEVPADVVKRTDGARDIRISIDDKGNVTYTFRTWGFQFSPEAGICYASNGNSRLVLNDQFLFYKKHNLNFGFGRNFNSNNSYRIYLAYGYNPKTKYLSNCNFLVGFDTDKNLITGVTVGL